MAETDLEEEATDSEGVDSAEDLVAVGLGAAEDSGAGEDLGAVEDSAVEATDWEAAGSAAED